jgi:Flp pilus assembly protein protease CpaA
MLFAVPIIIADLSERKIPNIYLLCYFYILIVVASFNGLNNVAQNLLVGVGLLGLNTLGLGMGDIKLIILITLLLPVTSFELSIHLFTLILVVSGLQVLLSWGISKVFPTSIAMAPAIFIGTSLYLATSGA